MPKQEKIEELDLCRVAAMLAVVMIHVTAPYCGRTSDATVLGMTLAQLLNQAARFAVPMFVLLSGTSLGFSRRTDSTAQFYRRRFVRIGVPYLLWFTVYEVYGILVLHTTDVHRLTLRRLLRALLQGQGTPHLYFVIIILQCYLFYPLLKRAVDRAPAATAAVSLVCTGAVQAALGLERAGVASLIPRWIRPYLWLLLPTWVFYFVLGMCMTRERLAALRRFAAAHRWGILLPTPVLMLLYAAGTNARGALESTNLLLDLYTPWMAAAGFALWQLIGGAAWLKKAVRFLSAHSLTVYFCHVLLLWELQKINWFARGISGMLPLYAATAAGAVLLAWMLDTLGSACMNFRK